MLIAVIGAQALYLFFAWLASGIVCSYLSGRKGYGERPGLATGIILPVVSVPAWLLLPAREGSDWKVLGPLGRSKPTEQLAAPPTD
jgi:hypothetical protein